MRLPIFYNAENTVSAGLPAAFDMQELTFYILFNNIVIN